ncbi:MAG: DUF983 domain-containing protein [Planctomycetales bacterium]
MIRYRCPRCLQGKVFRSLWRMHDTCPECALKYDREPGFFAGAMYFSYGLAILLALPTAILMFIKGISSEWTGLAVAGQLAVFSPLLFRWSRIMWMHFDQRIDPR